jgi:hypothetical protein
MDTLARRKFFEKDNKYDNQTYSKVDLEKNKRKMEHSKIPEGDAFTNF